MKKLLFLHKYYFLLFLIGALSGFPLQSYSQDLVPDSIELASLKALYDSTNGSGWTTNTNWLQGTTSADFATWYGVTVIDGDVHEVKVNNNNLQGGLPNAIGQLGELRNLNLISNSVSGQIPSGLGSLTKLESLYLNNNQLTGAVPAEIGNCTNLQVLYVHVNQLSGQLPASLGSLQNLRYFNVAYNHNLGGTLPPELGNITSLWYLYCHYAGLTGSIPSELGNLVNLKRLNLDNNDLSGTIPSSLGNLSAVTKMFLHNNNLSGTVPPEIGSVPNLQDLYISGNELDSLPQPSSFQNISNLNLFVQNNFLAFSSLEPYFQSGTPLSLSLSYSPQKEFPIDTVIVSTGSATSLFFNVGGSATAYQWYGFDEVNGTWSAISGATAATYDVPASEAAAGKRYKCEAVNSTVTGLNVTKPFILEEGNEEGIVPDATEYAALKALYDSTNGLGWTNNANWLQGTTSADFASWFGITVLNGDIIEINLSFNNLDGSIPNSIENLSNLIVLDLNFNSLTGQIPSGIGNLSKLQNLDLSTNILSGSFPPQIGNLQSLVDLNLNNNLLGASLPVEIGNMTSLLYLDLGKNYFSDTIPAAISGLSNLEYLELSSNDFSGSIPEEIGYLSNLKNLSLTSNQLSGSIPSSIGNLTNLEYLFLHYNHLEGPIPESIGSMVLLRYFYAHSNNITGSLPASIGNLSNLSYLYLTNNNLSGEIPSTIGNLTNLYYFHLGNNDFSGPLPETIGNLTNLGFLQLQDNGFSGALPASIGNLINLGTCYLYNNSFTGPIPSEIGNLIKLGRLYLDRNQLSGEIPATIGNMAKLDRIKLANNELEGAVPESILSLTKLVELDLAGNYFTTIPDLKVLPNLSGLKVTLQGNHLTFRELEKLFNSDGSTSFSQLTYVPQNISTAPDPATVSVDSIEEVFFEGGNSLTIHSSSDGEQTQYQWKKWDGSSWLAVTGATDSIYQKSNASTEDEGFYIVEKTNALTNSSFYIYSSLYKAQIRNDTDSIAPQAPTNLAVTDIQATQVSISWAAVEGTSSTSSKYNVYLNGIKINAELIDSTSYVINNLSSGEGYLLYVTAEDLEGDESSPSNEITLNPGNYTKIQVPIVLGSDDAEEYQSGSVHLASESMELTYDSLSNVGGYQMAGLRFAELNIPASAFIEQAYIQFRAFSVANDTTLLNIGIEESDSAATFSAINYDLSSRMVAAETIPWEPSPWKTAGTAEHAERTPNLASLVSKQIQAEGWKSGNSLSFILTGYGERVVSTVESGGPAMLVVWYSAEAPQAPSALVAEEDTVFISLSWEDHAFNEEGFGIERKTEGSSFSVLDTVAANTSQYADIAVVADSMYSYRVYAFNRQGNSTASNIDNAQLLPSVPSTPAYLTAEGVAPHQIKLQWQDRSSNEEGFTIERLAEDGTGWSVLQNVGKDVVSFVDTLNLTLGRRKMYRVKAYNNVGVSDASNQANAFTQHKMISNIRINAGEQNRTTINGNEWRPDAFYTGGSAMTTESSAPSFVSSKREGSFTYRIPLEVSGNYSMVFHFQEEQAEAAGQRIFKVLVDGNVVIENLDVFSETGKNVLLSRNITNLQLTGPEVQIEFRPVTGDAFVNGIEITYQDNPNLYRLFVKGDATGLSDGSSWENAFLHVNDALTEANIIDASSGIVEIWVAQGTYYPDPVDRTKSFNLVNHVALYGGFAGTEASLSERDWVSNKTILSGDIGTLADRSDNSYQIVKANNNATTIIDGFVITKGNANGAYPANSGGGMFIGDPSTTVQDFPTIRNIHFLENHAAQMGGGLFVEGVQNQKVLELTTCRFEGNYAQKGGGIYVATEDPEFVCKLVNSSYSGNVAQDGGAVYMTAVNESASLQVINSTFATNQANIANTNGTGAAIYGNSVVAEVYNSILWYNYNYLVQDSIHWNQVYFSRPDLARVEGNIFQDGYGSEADKNINVNPEFVTEPNPGEDFSWINDASDSLNVNMYGNLELEISSPAIDRATPELYPSDLEQDVIGRTRFYSSKSDGASMLDIGAYEHQQKEDTTPLLQPHFVIDSQSFDSTFSYTLSFSGYEDTIKAGARERFDFSDSIAQGDSIIVTLTLWKDGQLGEQLFVVVDSYAGKIVEPVYLDPELSEPLSSIFYQVRNFNELFIHRDNRIAEGPMYNLNLENGLFFRLRNGEAKNLLDLNLEAAPASYNFTIVDDAGVAVFETTDHNENWSGYNSLNNSRVAPGRYSYLLDIDGNVYRGQFLVSY